MVVEVVDAGLGMTDADLRMANMRLAAGGEVSPENARHMGLFVIARLAAPARDRGPAVRGVAGGARNHRRGLSAGDTC